MPTATAYRGRLPGVRCDPTLPEREVDGIRLDIAAFVGFAERGPLDDPQVVEDPAQYAAVFGGDLQLAFDDHGVPVYAALPDAVRSFFDNGGRRAYVVRVAAPELAAAPPVEVPVRVTSRVPLGDGAAVDALLTDLGRPLVLSAAFPGLYARRIAVDVDVLDTVLALATDDDAVVDLTSASRQRLDEGDALLVRRAESDGVRWMLLRVPAGSEPLTPPGGWRDGDVARLVRADLTVLTVGDDAPPTPVERFVNLRLGPGDRPGPSVCWTDVLQPADGGFRRDRSMYVRAPAGATTLIPTPNSPPSPVDALQAPGLPPAASKEALAADGLATFDPVALFLDPQLTFPATVEGLRLELELLGLQDAPHAHGLHALALQPEVSIVAVPDLYHRPWNEQPVLVDGPAPVDGGEAPHEPVGFHTCDAGPPPPPPPPIEPPPAAVLRMVIDSPADYRTAGAETVAGALADLCAARADMVAVLGLPRHAGLAEARHLADALAARRSSSTDVPSYTGIWHPWGALAERRTPDLAPLRPVPPDGAVAGTIAAIELSRGWWVEPAGRPLAGFLAVDPLDPAVTLALFDRGLNALRRRPTGFVATSAHTVSTDRQLLQLSVRRLLIHVRKLALREGSRFVFEPDDERFRAQVTTTFRRLLERLRVAGALAAYDVVVEPLATRPLADEGNLRIDLKLAPTSPIEFITVTLLRSGEGLVQVAGS